MYTFAIPAQNFASYQNKLDDYHTNFNIAKTSAIPKKKFTFAKKVANLQQKKDKT